MYLSDKRNYLDEKYGEHEYNIDVDSRVVAEGKETKVFTEDGKCYSGKWVRDLVKKGYFGTDKILLGYAEDKIHGPKPAYIPEENLCKHSAIFGTTGYGKTTLLTNLMIQFAYKGRGFMFIDPKGNDVNDFVRQLPEHRLDDVIWIDPDDAEREAFVGFNIFETSTDPDDPYYEREVQNIINDFHRLVIDGMETGQGGAIISTTTDELTNILVRLDEPYTFIDLIRILNSQEERKALAEKAREELDDVHIGYLDKIVDADDEDFGPLYRYLRKWEMPTPVRKVIGQEETSINISEAVNQDKIILIKGGNLSQNAQRLIFMMLIHRVRSAVQTRNQKCDDPDPFYMVVDEFNKVGGTSVENFRYLLSKGRSMKLGLVLASQGPTQLDKGLREEMKLNVDNYFSFSVGDKNQSGAREMADVLSLSAEQIRKLTEFNLIGLLETDEDKQTMLIKTYPPYPPRRSKEEARKILDHSVDKYGVSEDVTSNQKYGLIGRRKRDESEEKSDEIEKKVLKSIMRANIVTGGSNIDGKSGWVSKEDIVDAAKYYIDFNSEIEIHRQLERLTGRQASDKVVESRVKSDDEIYFRLTGEGEDRVWIQDTGSGGSSGKILHRKILEKSFYIFTKLGYIVDLPEQLGQQQPDGIAEPPFDPLEEAKSVDEVEKVTEKMKKDHPIVWELSKDSTLFIEAESPRREKKNAGSNPKQIIRNLAKAKNQGDVCAFVTFESDPENDNPPEYNAEGIRRILEEPPFARKRSQNGIEYYTDRGLIECNNVLPLVKADKNRTIWQKENNKIVLKHPDTKNAVAVFDSYNDLMNSDKVKFPYYTYEKPGTKENVVVKNKPGPGGDEKEVGVFDNLKEVKDNGYKTITPPIVAENIFEDNLPKDDDYYIIIIPYDKEGGIDEPHVYDKNTKNLIPLYDYDDKDEIEQQSLDDATDTDFEDIGDFDL